MLLLWFVYWESGFRVREAPILAPQTGPQNPKAPDAKPLKAKESWACFLGFGALGL